jgi:hypothetical protein
VHAIFINCYEDKAVRNARQFLEMLASMRHEQIRARP